MNEQNIGRFEITDLTPAARPATLTAEKPEERTAVACSNPTGNLVPMGIASTMGFPISKTKKKNQSTRLPQDASSDWSGNEVGALHT